MTSPSPILSIDDVVDIASQSFRPSDARHGSVGLEVEWIVVDRSDPGRAVSGDEVLAAASGRLPGDGSVGVEPGGQLELTTIRHDDAWQAIDAAAIDELVLQRRMNNAGLKLLATGIDPWRPPYRSLDQPRYRAMEAAFDVFGPEGRVMMCSTAALQINVDFGVIPLETWERAGLVAPILAAAFANSPKKMPDGSTQASARAATWAAIDPTRTSPVPVGSKDPWAQYALDANVLFVRHGDDAHAVSAPFTLTQWIEGGHPLGYPDAEDIAVHLTTLFPPVRPRGWLECRSFDALPAYDRRVAVLTLVALTNDEAPLDAVRAACAAAVDPWTLVARGTADSGMRRAAESCLALAADVLDVLRPKASEPVRAWTAHRRECAWGSLAADLQSVVPLEQEIH